MSQAKLTAAELAKLNDVKNTGTQKSNTYGYAILNISHAFQDLTYGIAAALNNIPLVVTSLGGSAGLAGGLMAAGVALQLLRENFHKFAVGAPTEMIPLGLSLAELKKKIEDIQKNPLKFSGDFAALDEAQKRIDKFQKQLDAFNSASAERTDIQGKVAKAVRNVVVEESGATDEAAGAENLARIMKRVAQEKTGTFYAGDPEAEKLAGLKASLEKTKKLIASPSDPEMVPGLEKAASNLESQIATLEHEIEQRSMERIRKQIGGALRGEDAPRAALVDAFRKYPEMFQAHRGRGITGVSPEFGSMMEQASGANIRAVEKEEHDEKQTEEKTAFDRDLRGFRKMVKARDDAAERQQREIDRGQGAVEAARDKAMKDAKREAHGMEAATEQDARAAAAARNRDVNQHATRYGTEFRQEGDLTGAILGRLKAGKAPSAGLAAQVKGRLTDVPGDMADEVANKIVDDAVRKVQAEVAAAGGGRRGVSAAMAGHQDKLRRAQMAADNRGMHEARNADEAALGEHIFQGMGGWMNPRAAMSAAHRAAQMIQQGVDESIAINAAIMRTLQQIEHAMGNMQHGNRMNRAQLNRMQGQRPPVMPTF
jgi:hypothetical protein